jgi:hypothetical protein
MLRAVAFAAGTALLAQAPLQCAREPEPDLREYETPPDALYDLAGRLKGQHDDRGYRTTLEYLVERYPNSRFAIRAKDDLARGADAGAHAKLP